MRCTAEEKFFGKDACDEIRYARRPKPSRIDPERSSNINSLGTEFAKESGTIVMCGAKF
jgi:hypothetical protein